MVAVGRPCSPKRRRRAMTAFVFNTDDAIVSPPFAAFISVHWRSSAVETHVFSPFSVSLTLTSVHGHPSRVHLLRPGLRTSFQAEPEIGGFERTPFLTSNRSPMPLLQSLRRLFHGCGNNRWTESFGSLRNLLGQQVFSTRLFSQRERVV